MLDGCVVMENGDLLENQAVWQYFWEASQSGEPAAVTVVQYTREKSDTTYIRYGLVFDGGIYTLKISAEEQQISCTFTGLEMTAGPSYIRYTLTGGTDTADVVIVEDRVAAPELSNISTVAFHLKQGEPPLRVYEAPEETEAIVSLLKGAEYQMVPPEGYILGVKLILHTEAEQEILLEVDILQGIYRYGNNYYCYGELSDLFRVLGFAQWPEEVKKEYSSYL